MTRYMLRRVLLMIPTILGAGVLVFFLMRVIPGDICLVRWVDYGTDLDPALLDFCRNQLGLNDPLYIQFFYFMKGVFTFDFGVSMWTGKSIIEELELRFALSLQVAIMATLVNTAKKTTKATRAMRIIGTVGPSIRPVSQ